MDNTKLLSIEKTYNDAYKETLDSFINIDEPDLKKNLYKAHYYFENTFVFSYKNASTMESARECIYSLLGRMEAIKELAQHLDVQDCKELTKKRCPLPAYLIANQEHFDIHDEIDLIIKHKCGSTEGEDIDLAQFPKILNIENILAKRFQ